MQMAEPANAVQLRAQVGGLSGKRIGKAQQQNANASSHEQVLAG
jgi:hypothetical protein